MTPAQPNPGQTTATRVLDSRASGPDPRLVPHLDAIGRLAARSCAHRMQVPGQLTCSLRFGGERQAPLAEPRQGVRRPLAPATSLSSILPNSPPPYARCNNGRPAPTRRPQAAMRIVTNSPAARLPASPHCRSAPPRANPALRPLCTRQPRFQPPKLRAVPQRSKNFANAQRSCACRSRSEGASANDRPAPKLPPPATVALLGRHRSARCSYILSVPRRSHLAALPPTAACRPGTLHFAPPTP